jgi:hypothetical protein
METNNETKIDYDGESRYLPSRSVSIRGKDFYERLQDHNRDVWWAYREDATISKDVDNDFKKYLLIAFTSQVGLTSLQTHLALKRFMKLDLRRGTGRAEENALLICAIIANKTAERHGGEKLYHPQRSDNDRAFDSLETNLMNRFPRVTSSSLTKIYNKLTQGNPPIRPAAEWKDFVHREAEVQVHPNHVDGTFEPDLTDV